MHFGGEYMEVPASGVIWQSRADIPVPPNIGMTIRMPVVEHHLTYHRVINPPWQAISEQVGSVNNAPFLGAAAEQVLFDGCDADREFTWLGDFQAPQLGWRMSYVFREKRVDFMGADKNVVGWNHFWREKPHNAPAWDKLDAAGGPVYELTNFASLFEFAATD